MYDNKRMGNTNEIYGSKSMETGNHLLMPYKREANGGQVRT